jgi:hypothetical protein
MTIGKGKRPRDRFFIGAAVDVEAPAYGDPGES